MKCLSRVQSRPTDPPTAQYADNLSPAVTMCGVSSFGLSRRHTDLQRLTPMRVGLWHRCRNCSWWLHGQVGFISGSAHLKSVQVLIAEFACYVRFPIVPGHEAVGVIAKLGPGVKGYELGQRVACDNASACGCCGCCKEGKDLFCDDFASKGCNMRVFFIEN